MFQASILFANATNLSDVCVHFLEKRKMKQGALVWQPFASSSGVVYTLPVVDLKQIAQSATAVIP